MNVESYVYFIRPVGMTGPVKIGCSASPLNRLEQLASWSPFPLEIVATTPGDLKLEHVLHQCFADDHSHHEWFKESPRLSRCIEALKSGLPLADAVDLNDRRLYRNGTKSRCSPEVRRRMSYQMRLHWAERKLADASAYYSLTDADDDILVRWRGYGCLDGKSYSAEPIIPTAAEFSRLEAIIGDPRAHLIRCERSRKLAA